MSIDRYEGAKSSPGGYSYIRVKVAVLELGTVAVGRITLFMYIVQLSTPRRLSSGITRPGLGLDKWTEGGLKIIPFALRTPLEIFCGVQRYVVLDWNDRFPDYELVIATSVSELAFMGTQGHFIFIFRLVHRIKVL